MLISLKDTCEILRSTGVTDATDNELVDTIYSGACLYQEKVSTTYPEGITTRKPLVFLRSAGVTVMIGDIVNVTTEEGREERSIVRLVRDIKLSGVSYTRIELKANQGD